MVCVLTTVLGLCLQRKATVVWRRCLSVGHTGAVFFSTIVFVLSCLALIPVCRLFCLLAASSALTVTD